MNVFILITYRITVVYMLFRYYPFLQQREGVLFQFYRCYLPAHLNKYSINTTHSVYPHHEFVNSVCITKAKGETFGQIVEECFIGDKDEEVSYSRQVRLSEAAYQRECSK